MTFVVVRTNFYAVRKGFTNTTIVRKMRLIEV